MKRLDITEKASLILEKIKDENEELIFHQSGGCCDGTAPMLMTKDEFYLDESDVFIGEVCAVNYYMNIDQFEYWKYSHLTIDIIEGRGSSFSLEIPLGFRFVIQSRLLTTNELDFLSK